MSHRLIFTNKAKLNNTNYISGSGVGAVSTSNRRVLNRRANVNVNATTLLNVNATILNTYPTIYFVARFDANQTHHDNYMDFSEIEIYTKSGKNIARGKNASAKSSFNDGGLAGSRVASRVTDGVTMFRSNNNNGDVGNLYSNGDVNTTSNTKAMQYLEIDLGPPDVTDPIVSIKIYLGFNFILRANNLEFLFLPKPYLSYFTDGIPNNSSVIPNSLSYKTLTNLSFTTNSDSVSAIVNINSFTYKV